MKALRRGPNAVGLFRSRGILRIAPHADRRQGKHASEKPISAAVSEQ
jgi:hypothetical protein